MITIGDTEAHILGNLNPLAILQIIGLVDRANFTTKQSDHFTDVTSRLTHLRVLNIIDALARLCHLLPLQ